MIEEVVIKTGIAFPLSIRLQKPLHLSTTCCVSLLVRPSSLALTSSVRCPLLSIESFVIQSFVPPITYHLGSRSNRPSHHRVGKVPLSKTIFRRLTPHENIYTLPNILTFSRLLAAPFVGYFIATSQHTLALGLFAYAGITDLVDGYIARRYSMQTVVGTVIDPMADKALMTISVIALAMRSGIPWWLASLILLRDVGLGVAAIYYRWISLPAPKTMARYWDFSLPSAEVHPTGISKFNTFLQLLLVGAGVALPVVPAAIVHDYGLTAGFELFQ